MTFFTPWQIYTASCLGSPLAGAWLMVRNHRALHHPEQGRQAVGLGLAATIVVIAIALMLPSSLPVAGWPFLYSLGSYFYARRVCGEEIAHALGTVGQQGAWWRVIGISFGFFFVLFGVVLALALVFPGLFVSDSPSLSSCGYEVVETSPVMSLRLLLNQST